MAIVITLGNHKGGVCKTTSTANLGAALREHGERVLVVDADPQANLTEAFGADGEPPTTAHLEELLAAPRLESAPRPLASLSHAAPLPAGVHLLPCTDALADVATELTGSAKGEFRLRAALELLRPAYDFILIDTPPGIVPLSTMALLASDWLVIPAQPADHDIAGAAKVYDLVETTLRAYNPRLETLGVLLTKVEGSAKLRRRLVRDSYEALTADGIPVLPVEIPKAASVAAAPRYGAPTVVVEPYSRVAWAYLRLARYLRELRDGLAEAA